MRETSLEINLPAARCPLRVVVAYHDVVAGQYAMHVLAKLGQEFGETVEFKPVLWSFDVLADLDWCEIAASDAIQADLLIIATSSPQPIPPAVERWAEIALGQKRGTSSAVVALFGSADNPDGAGSLRLDAIRTAAREAGLEFFAPMPRAEEVDAVDRIHQRAELLTPCLEEILHHIPAVSTAEHSGAAASTPG